MSSQAELNQPRMVFPTTPKSLGVLRLPGSIFMSSQPTTPFPQENYGWCWKKPPCITQIGTKTPKDKNNGHIYIYIYIYIYFTGWQWVSLTRVKIQYYGQILQQLCYFSTNPNSKPTHFLYSTLFILIYLPIYNKRHIKPS